MSKKDKGPQTAAAFRASLEQDTEYQARKAVFDAQHKAETDALRVAEAPLIEALNRAGFSVTSVWDFVNTNTSYTAALPVLLKHLQVDYPDKVREGIARAMAVPQSRFAWQSLRTLFERTFDPHPNGVKWAIGCALAAAADDDVMPELISLFQERRHGVNRVAFVEPLSRSRLANARAALEAGRHDPELKTEISRVLDARRRRGGGSRDP